MWITVFKNHVALSGNKICRITSSCGTGFLIVLWVCRKEDICEDYK